MGQQDFGVTDTPDRGSSKQFPSQGDPRAGGKVRVGRLLWDWFSGGSGRPQEGFEVILVAEQRMSLRKENGCIGGEARRWLSGAWVGGVGSRVGWDTEQSRASVGHGALPPFAGGSAASRMNHRSLLKE